MTAQDYKAPDSVGRLQRNALVVGGIGLLLCIVAAIKSPQIFFPSYLMGFLLVLGLALGSLGLLMLQHLTGGHWGIVIRRPLESATRTLPLVAVLVSAHRVWDEVSLRRVARSGTSARRAALGIAAELPDRARLLRARGDLFRDVAAADVHLQSLVARAGRQPGRPRCCGGASRCWPGRESFFTSS